MPQNIVGPHGAGINESTTRPTDTPSESSIDSWFTPCIGGDPNTGTKIPAVWLNKVTALLRRAIRGMGVTDLETDDDMLLKAIQRAARAISNLGTGVGLYKGFNSGANTNEFYSLKAGSGVTLGLDTLAGELTITAGAGGISDGDKGDVTVSSSGTVWEIDALAVTTAKINNSAVTNAKLAAATAQTLKGNPTNDSANPVDIVPSTLPVGSSSANDYVVGHDSAGVLRRYQTSAFGSVPGYSGGQFGIGSVVMATHTTSPLTILPGATMSGSSHLRALGYDGEGTAGSATLNYGTWRMMGSPHPSYLMVMRIA
jgi:hypothetical protein